MLWLVAHQGGGRGGPTMVAALLVVLRLFAISAHLAAKEHGGRFSLLRPWWWGWGGTGDVGVGLRCQNSTWRGGRLQRMREGSSRWCWIFVLPICKLGWRCLEAKLRVMGWLGMRGYRWEMRNVPLPCQIYMYANVSLLDFESHYE